MANTDLAPRIIDFRHSIYTANAVNWPKWRSVYAGGDDFIDNYLEQFSLREDSTDFNLRRKITPTPSFAKAAINDIKNSIFQRLTDVSRKGGSKEYQAAVEGRDNGVDLHGNSMNSFIGQFLLPELLTMARVGVYVDMPKNPGNTLLEAAGKRPYIYMYRAEEILSWKIRQDRADEFSAVLLRDWVDFVHPETGLTDGMWERYRHIWLGDDKKVHVQYYNEDAELVDEGGQPSGEFILDIDFIPFTFLELNDSLLADVANHQIALLNMESADVMYALKANFPFYIEQRDMRLNSQHLKQSAPDGTGTGPVTAGSQEIEVGTMQGRAYPMGVSHPPEFIAPPSEPLQVSMEKQKQLKDDIRQLVNLALSNIKPKMASAESKSIDERGLEAGLSNIGLVLEHAERKIALYWAAYEGDIKAVATVKYPEKYSLVSTEDRLALVKQLNEIREEVPSTLLRKEISKRIAALLIGPNVTAEQLESVYKEIDDAPAISADPETIFGAVEKGILDLELAAKLMGYPKGTSEKAAANHLDRITRIAESQAAAKTPTDPGARGVGDLSGNPGAAAKDEKTAAADQTMKGTPADAGRGPGK